jgi:hypothetical protein
MDVLNETGQRLLALLECGEVSDPCFKGCLPEMSRLTPFDLGRLLPIARTLPQLPPGHPALTAALHLERHARLVEPSFRPEDARAICGSPSHLRRKRITPMRRCNEVGASRAVLGFKQIFALGRTLLV